MVAGTGADVVMMLDDAVVFLGSVVDEVNGGGNSVPVGTDCVLVVCDDVGFEVGVGVVVVGVGAGAEDGTVAVVDANGGVPAAAGVGFGDDDD